MQCIGWAIEDANFNNTYGLMEVLSLIQLNKPREYASACLDSHPMCKKHFVHCRVITQSILNSIVDHKVRFDVHYFKIPEAQMVRQRTMGSSLWRLYKI